jgi:uncharacterized protein YprB with RNaseH-like and TPR domain
MAETDDLFDKLKSLGVQLGAGQMKTSPKQRQSDYGIENVVKGYDFQTAYGLTYLVQEQYPADYMHGLISLCADREMDVLAAYSGTPRITQRDGYNVVFLDTETSGLAGGTGTYAFLVGIGFRTPTGFEVMQFFMRDPAQEPSLLAALDQWLARFNVVVTFNGKSFDLPLLNTRYIMNGFSSPFGGFEHVDVLHVARKLWRDRLPSRALGELEKEIIQFYRAGEDIPGWMIPPLYFDYLRDGDARPLAGIFYHNAHDILSLAALYSHIAGILKDPLNLAAGYGFDLAAIARLYEDMGWIGQAAQLYERSLELGDLPEEFFYKTIERYALLHRRNGNWEKAAQLWKKAAEHGQVFACIELAKYYEHHERNYVEALQWSKKALESLEIDRYFSGSGRVQEVEIERRIGRLSVRVYGLLG